MHKVVDTFHFKETVEEKTLNFLQRPLHKIGLERKTYHHLKNHFATLANQYNNGEKTPYIQNLKRMKCLTSKSGLNVPAWILLYIQSYEKKGLLSIHKIGEELIADIEGAFAKEGIDINDIDKYIVIKYKPTPTRKTLQRRKKRAQKPKAPSVPPPPIPAITPPFIKITI